VPDAHPPPRPVPGALSPPPPPPELLAPDEHVIPRLLVTVAGAFTSGVTGLVALVLLALEATHQTGYIFLGLAAFALFTAVAELITVASLATDRRMVTWLGWAVAPGHAAGAAMAGYFLREIGLAAPLAAAAATAFAAVMIYYARRGSLAVFDASDRKRRPDACSHCGYTMGDLDPCPEGGRTKPL